jgi:hypothetical protein
MRNQTIAKGLAQRGLTLIETVIAIGVLTLLVLALTHLNLNSSNSRRSAKQATLFDGKVKEITTLMESRETCDCILKTAFAADGESLLSRLARNDTPSGLSLPVNSAFSLNSIRLVPGAEPRVDCCLNGSATDTDCPNNKTTVARIDPGPGGATDASRPSQESFTISNMQLRNIRYGGRVQRDNGSESNLEIYLSDFVVEGARAEKQRAGLSSSTGVLFVVENVPPRRFYSCFATAAFQPGTASCPAPGGDLLTGSQAAVCCETKLPLGRNARDEDRMCCDNEWRLRAGGVCNCPGPKHSNREQDRCP